MQTLFSLVPDSIHPWLLSYNTSKQKLLYLDVRNPCETQKTQIFSYFRSIFSGKWYFQHQKENFLIPTSVNPHCNSRVLMNLEVFRTFSLSVSVDHGYHVSACQIYPVLLLIAHLQTLDYLNNDLLTYLVLILKRAYAFGIIKIPKAYPNIKYYHTLLSCYHVLEIYLLENQCIKI